MSKSRRMRRIKPASTRDREHVSGVLSEEQRNNIEKKKPRILPVVAGKIILLIKCTTANADGG